MKTECISKRRSVFFRLSVFLMFLSFSTLCAYGDIIIDNGGSGTSYTGTWTVSGGSQPYGTDSLWSRNGDTYTWQFSSQPAGTYEVLLWWTAYSSRSSNAAVDINYWDGTTRVYVNQQQSGENWNSVGTFYFGGSGSVMVTASNGSDVSTCADAVWFRLVSANSPPSAYIDSIMPNPAESAQPITFTGHGTDGDGSIAAHQWESSVDGVIGNSASFSTTSLSAGVHTISYNVQDNQGIWSKAATAVLTVNGAVIPEIIVDNRDAGTSRTGKWQVSGGTSAYGADSLWSRDGATFTWQANLPQKGLYEVSMWWTAYSSRSANVMVTINRSGGSDVVYVNQQQNGGKWNSAGTFYFGGSGSVMVTASNGSDVSTCADAVKFSFIPLPVAVIDSITPNPAELGDQITFTGHGEAMDGTVAAYKWESDAHGLLSEQASFTISASSLGHGIYNITFSVRDDKGRWSTGVSRSLTVGNVPPTAVIDSITPNPAEITDTVSFTGRGEDIDGTITGYLWESSIDGVLSDKASFSRSSLSLGNHTISFSVYDNEGAKSKAATQLLTVNESAVSVIIDNGDKGTSYTGKWSVSSSPNPYDTDSLWSRDGATYTWTFTPSISAVYQVSMWWTVWSSRSKNIPVDIQRQGGTTRIYVNQQENGGQWNALGEFNFQAGNSYKLTIISQPKPTSTCADAVKFVKMSQERVPVAEFSADRTYGGSHIVISFTDQSLGIAKNWLWNFGDGQSSTVRNPAHEYVAPGVYTVSLAVSNSIGSDKETKADYIHIVEAVENIYLCDAYSSDIEGRFIPECIEVLQRLGAVEDNGIWVYRNPSTNITHFVHIVRTPEAMELALKEEKAHIIFDGHANFGLGATFATTEERRNQQINNIYFVDDDRFTSFSSDMVSLKPDGVKYGQAYPNWEPIFKDGTSGIMPYDFNDPRGNPPYNYYLTYKVPGDSNVYKVEQHDGSLLRRFPDSGSPPWFSPDGSPPDPKANREYFITNPDPDFDRFYTVGNWPFGKKGDGYMGENGYYGYNYQYHSAGTGANVATWNCFMKVPGYYNLLASWYADPSNASNAKYTIHHGAGTSVVEVDQRVTASMNYLGTFYFGSGSYKIELSDNANARVVADTIILDPLANGKVLQTEFQADVRSGQTGLTVQFADLSTYYYLYDFGGTIKSWHWDFGDGVFSNLQNPIHTYENAGLYTVSLKVTDSSGAEDTEVKTNFISVGIEPPLKAEFTAPKRMSSDKITVNFVDQSSGNITGWNWDFGDGSASTEQNPVHTYMKPGLYTVSLTVFGPGGSDKLTESNFIYNLIPLIYVDNTFQYKQHFFSRYGPIAFGKVIVDTRRIKIPEADLKYSRMFYRSCNSANYYVGTFHRGIMFATVTDADVRTSVYYLDDYLRGMSDEAIQAHLNSIMPGHEYFNFDLPPPSLR